MRTLVPAVFLLALIVAAMASHKDPYHRNCPIGNKDLSDGEEWADQQRCVKYKCQIRGPDAALLLTRCPSVGIYPPDKCREIAGKGNFPDCCPKLQCD